MNALKSPISGCGTVTRSATVTVNNQPTERQGDYFRKEFALANSSSAAWTSLTNLGVLNDGTNPDITETNIGFAFLPQTPQSFLHDADGNLTNDGRFAYFWDAENRLTKMESLPTPHTESMYKLECQYDYRGRRVRKVVSTNDGSGYRAQYTNLYAYDGWNLIAILDGATNLLYSLQWGTDASGTMQGAGGVGGLLSMRVHNGPQAGTYFYCYDGNFNVMGLVSASSGGVVAEYEYGPFGELIRATGPLAKVNPFMFSTKYHDWETGLYYYGFRSYNPSTGRWLSRDPIGEVGGINLFAFVGNQPVQTIDHIGLYMINLHGQLVRSALNYVYYNNQYYISERCQDKIEGYIVEGNVGTDLYHSFDDRRHYCRSIGGSRQSADTDYQNYVRGEESDFEAQIRSGNPRTLWPRCRRALKALGRASHSWQDFFIHAIRRDGLGGKENSDFTGWTAWTATPPKTGDPENRGNFWPSSFRLSGGGEHPGGIGNEPILSSSPEWGPRFAAAEEYTRMKFVDMVPRWYEICRCPCESREPMNY